jgi:hypothetical protein
MGRAFRSFVAAAIGRRPTLIDKSGNNKGLHRGTRVLGFDRMGSEDCLWTL